MSKLFILIAAVVLVACMPYSLAAKSKGGFSGCTFLYSTAEMAREKLVAFFDTLHFAPGEHIAEVGAGGANLPGMFSLMYGDFDFTLEDIDTICLKERQITRVLEYYSGLNAGRQPQGMSYHVVIGNDSSTTLPAAAYQKVFFINTYHELTKPRQMLADIRRILAPDGLLYMQEEVTTKCPTLRKSGCNHLMPVESELLQAMQDAGFRLKKVNVVGRYRHVKAGSRSSWYQFVKA